jgi:hypothetical protein
MMPAPKEPAPSSATDRLASTQAALAQANARIAELDAQRNAALLKDEDATAVKLGTEIDALKQAARAHSDKIALLKEQAAEEERARRAREREELIERIEKKLVQRDAAMEGVAAAIKQLASASERAITLGREIIAAWTWAPHDLPPALLTPAAIMTTISHESFRVSYHAKKYGGADVDVLAGHSLPGSRSPTWQLAEDPSRVRPMIDVVRDATEFAKTFLRTGKGSAAVVNDANLSGATGQIEASTNGQSEPPQIRGGDAQVPHGSMRSDAEQRLSDLLVQMHKLAQDGSQEGERRYLEVVSQVAQVQAEVSAQQQVEQQHHGR